jgi:hypothetical protein|tara:strand:+ start:165 stop:554 length:390 start_codon:yes stop_codon:yes gene_type:complete
MKARKLNLEIDYTYDTLSNYSWILRDDNNNKTLMSFESYSGSSQSHLSIEIKSAAEAIKMIRAGSWALTNLIIGSQFKHLNDVIENLPLYRKNKWKNIENQEHVNEIDSLKELNSLIQKGGKIIFVYKN